MGLFSRASKYPPAPKPKDYEKMVCPWEKDIPNMVPDVKPGDSKWSFINPDLIINRLHLLAHDEEGANAKLSREQVYEHFFNKMGCSNVSDKNERFAGLHLMLFNAIDLRPREGNRFVIRNKDGTYYDFHDVAPGRITQNDDNGNALCVFGFYIDKTTKECIVINNYPDPKKNVFFLDNISGTSDLEITQSIHDAIVDMDIFHSDLPASCNLSPVYDYKACYRDYMDKKNAIYKSTGMIDLSSHKPDTDEYAKVDTDPVEERIQSWELGVLYKHYIRPQMEWYTRERNYDRDKAECDAFLKCREETEEKLFGKEPEGYIECANVAYMEACGLSYPVHEHTKKKYDYEKCVKRHNDIDEYGKELNKRCMTFKASGITPSSIGEAKAVSEFKELEPSLAERVKESGVNLKEEFARISKIEEKENEQKAAALQAKLDKSRQEIERQQALANASASSQAPAQAVPSYAQIAQMPPEEQRKYTKHLFEEMPPKELAEEFARCNEENRKILMDLKTAYDKDKERREQEQKFAEAMGFGNYWKELNKDK